MVGVREMVGVKGAVGTGVSVAVAEGSGVSAAVGSGAGASVGAAGDCCVGLIAGCGAAWLLQPASRSRMTPKAIKKIDRVNGGT